MTFFPEAGGNWLVGRNWLLKFENIRGNWLFGENWPQKIFACGALEGADSPVNVHKSVLKKYTIAIIIAVLRTTHLEVKQLDYGLNINILLMKLPNRIIISLYMLLTLTGALSFFRLIFATVFYAETVKLTSEFFFKSILLQ